MDVPDQKIDPDPSIGLGSHRAIALARLPYYVRVRRVQRVGGRAAFSLQFVSPGACVNVGKAVGQARLD
jgi:hypothetical protein